jgi:hypothetical protein
VVVAPVVAVGTTAVAGRPVAPAPLATVVQPAGTLRPAAEVAAGRARTTTLARAVIAPTVTAAVE